MTALKKYIPHLAIFTIASVSAYYILFKLQNMKYPVNGRISSKFGYRTHPATGVAGKLHNGVDIAVPIGTPVIAPFDGQVVNVYQNSTGGKQMIVQHTNGFRTGYAHLNDTLFAIGQTVKKGDVIAKSGNTGASTGPHLHLTLRKNGELVDPELYFSFA